MTIEEDDANKNLAKAYCEVSPYPSDRKILVQQLLTSAGYCEEAGSSAWSVTLTTSGYRLNVGQVEALTNRLNCMDKKTFGLPTDRWFADFRVLISGPDAPQLVRTLAADCRVDPMEYKSVGEPHWCVTVTIPLRVSPSDPERLKAMLNLGAVQSAHRHYVAAATQTPTGKLRQKSNFGKSHCAALVTFARTAAATIVSSARYPDQIWNEELTVDGVPGPAAPWDDISMFALTTNVYDAAYVGGRCDLSEALNRKHELSFTALRNTLFDCQRGWRWSQGHGERDEGHEAADLVKIRQLLDEIRQRVADQRFD